jgi:hypothetical protein
LQKDIPCSRVDAESSVDVLGEPGFILPVPPDSRHREGNRVRAAFVGAVEGRDVPENAPPDAVALGVDGDGLHHGETAVLLHRDAAFVFDDVFFAPCGVSPVAVFGKGEEQKKEGEERQEDRKKPEAASSVFLVVLALSSLDSARTGCPRHSFCVVLFTGDVVLSYRFHGVPPRASAAGIAVPVRSAGFSVRVFRIRHVGRRFRFRKTIPRIGAPVP